MCGGPLPPNERTAYGRCEDCAVANLPGTVSVPRALLSIQAASALDTMFNYRSTVRSRGRGGKRIKKKDMDE